MKVLVVCGQNDSFYFERDVNKELQNLEKQGREIIDIKFSASEYIHYPAGWRFNAMIIYK